MGAWLSKARFKRSLSAKRSEADPLGFAYKKPRANTKATLKRAFLLKPKAQKSGKKRAFVQKCIFTKSKYNLKRWAIILPYWALFKSPLGYICTLKNLAASTKRQSLQQILKKKQKLNDLVFVKYNRALRRRYELRDTIPILLNDIDESNEWLTGRLREESENDYVFGEEDGLTYNDVYNASGVREPLYRSRSQSRATNANNRKSGSSSRHLIDEIEDEDVHYENEEQEIEFVENGSLDLDSDEEWEYIGEEEDVYGQI